MEPITVPGAVSALEDETGARGGGSGGRARSPRAGHAPRARRGAPPAARGGGGRRRPASRLVVPGRAHRLSGGRRDPDALAASRPRPPRLLRPPRPSRARSFRPLPAAHDGRGHGRPGRGRDPARAGVPPGGDLRRSAPGRAPGHPRGRGQELPLALGGRLQRAAAGDPEGRGTLARGVVERLRAPAEASPGRVDPHPAARARLLPAVPDRPPGRRRPVHAGLDRAAVDGDRRGGSRHQQAPSEAGGGAPRDLARGGDAPGVPDAGAGQARDLLPVRELHLHGQRPVRLRRGLRVLLRQAAGDLHDRGCRAGGATRRDRQVAPRLCAHDGQPATAGAPQPDPRPDGPQRVHRGGSRPAGPGRADRRRSPRAGEDRGARGDRPRAGRDPAVRWRCSSRWRTCFRAGYASNPRSISGCRESSTRPWRTAWLVTRSGIPGPGGSSRVRSWCWPTRTRQSSPRRGDGSTTTFAPAATPTTTA